MRRLTLVMLLLGIAVGAMAQTPFNGRITRSDGKGVKARISVVGKDKHTTSDGKGRFGLTDVEADDALEIVVKRDTLRVALEGRRSIDVVWDMGGSEYVAEESEDLMNYGYGYVKRRESTDYSSGISGDRLRATGAMGLVEAIQMCYPGLRYINGELCLRTQNTINGSSAVLVLCDGMEIRPELVSIYDVKSVEIIKGSNMYGFRGVNGVVLITTMNGADAMKRER
ncbi:MAG: TonB-dependent receptor plug domain-containing protein [Alistipes sp.]|nr:TonB-dependent receptor plug domain-containing protein [Alistipes sp.]